MIKNNRKHKIEDMLIEQTGSEQDRLTLTFVIGSARDNDICILLGLRKKKVKVVVNVLQREPSDRNSPEDKSLQRMA
jgi:hypothetical protein